jgi:hypothetical protein
LVDHVLMAIAAVLFIVLIGFAAVLAGADSRIDETEHRRRLWGGVN